MLIRNKRVNVMFISLCLIARRLKVSRKHFQGSVSYWDCATIFDRRVEGRETTMLAAMFYAPMDVRLEERPIPQVGPGEVLLKVAAATTCGTDVKTYRRGHPLLFRHPPAGFGHEVAGIVAAIGTGVTQCREGDAIVVTNSAPCYQCFYCRRGRYSLCEDLLLLNGAYAEYLLVPERIVCHNLYQ